MNIHSHTYLKWGYDVAFSMKVKKMEEKRWQIQRGNCVVQKKDIVFFNTVQCFLNILIQWKYFYTCGWKVSTVDIFRISDIFRVFLKSENLGNCLNSFDFCKTFNITNNISKDAISPLELSPNKHLAHSRIKQIFLSGISNNQILYVNTFEEKKRSTFFYIMQPQNTRLRYLYGICWCVRIIMVWFWYVEAHKLLSIQLRAIINVSYERN